jgi:two-component system LytT family response regulator
LAAKLNKINNVEIIAECSNGREALKQISNLTPDLVFMDIQMPGLSGLEVVKRIQNDVMPMVVFATAYEQYALDAFDANAVDYVLKPIDDERIQRAVSRSLERLHSQAASPSESSPSENKKSVINAIADINQKQNKTVTWYADEHITAEPETSVQPFERKIVIKDRDQIHLLKQKDIEWIDAAGDYVCVHACGETHVKRSTLKEMLDELDETTFKRVHRSTIVNLNFIDKVIPHTKGEFFLMIGEHDKIKVSRNYKDTVKAFLES